MPMTYDSLTTQISQYANRTDNAFMAQIPNFIEQAIDRIYSEAKNIGFERVVTNNNYLTANQPFINKPRDWRETISIQYTIPGITAYTTFLLPRTYEFCVNYWPNSIAVSPPIFYANYGNQSENVGNVGTSSDQFFISPTPDQNYPGTIIYLGIPIFNAEFPTNFLTQRYPSLLLYASMLESVPFLKDDERVPVYESLYNRALQDINRDTKERYIDRTSKRDID